MPRSSKPHVGALVLALAIPLVAAESAAASRIVYNCGDEVCVVHPDTGASQQLTSDGAASPYRYPSVSRDGRVVAAARGADVMVGAYGENLTTRWAGTRNMNDVAMAPDGSGVGESHSYVENRYGCPLTGGCLQLVDMSATFYVAAGAPNADHSYNGGGGVGFLGAGAGALLSSHYTIGDDLHHICVVDTPGAPEAPCTVRISSPAGLTDPDGSPDGTLIAVAVLGATGADPATIALFDAASGAPVRQLGNGSDPTFSPDGKQLAYVAPDGWINVLPVTGGTSRRLVQGASPSWGEGDAPGPAVRSSSLRQRKGKVPVKVGCTGKSACSGTLRIKKGKTTLGSRKFRVRADKSATVSVPLNARGRRTVARSRSHKVTVELKAGARAVLSEKLTLRR